MADQNRLRQLLENLIRNAIEHGTGDEKSDITPADLTITVEDVPGGFAVSDDGVGIPEAERDVIFESGHTTRSKNTGFGLAIVEEIVSAHGWSVRATESESGGARFEFVDVDKSNATREDRDGADGDTHTADSWLQEDKQP